MTKASRKAGSEKTTKVAKAGKAVAQAPAAAQSASKKRRASEEAEDAQPAPKIVKSSGNKKVKLSSELRPLSATADESAAQGGAGKRAAGTIIYLGHIPDGFYEPQMDKFFEQFGKVKRVKLFRSKKTNRSRGYAFIEFESAEVASIVAESMNGYFLMERKMVSHVVPPEKVHDKMFAKPKATARARPSDSDDDSNDSDDDDDAEVLKTIDDGNFARVSRLHAKSMAQKQAKLKELGIDFTVPFAVPVEARALPAEASAPKTPAGKKRSAAAAAAAVSAGESSKAAEDAQSKKKKIEEDVEEEREAEAAEEEEDGKKKAKAKSTKKPAVTPKKKSA